MRKRLQITVSGLVQGIGFRPFVAELAETSGLNGKVRNAGGRVFIEAEGEEEELNVFVQKLSSECPQGGRVDLVEIKEEPGTVLPGFFISESREDSEAIRFLPPDLATCERCEKELFTKGNRRYRHPFISCVSCGPRYSVMKDVPYDRKNLTMDEFALCHECRMEYEAPGDRRRYAQTLCCPECGPQVKAVWADGEAGGEEAIAQTIEVLRSGKLAAVKGIGGFHLVCLPTEKEALLRLRDLKSRDHKPFAVMFYDLEGLKEYAAPSDRETELLTSSVRPIVLLKKKKEFDPEVSKGSGRIGAMLPSHPIQFLLLRDLGPLVMTSANLHDQPILTEEEELLPLLKEGKIDLILTHDRKILSPLDDSIFQVVNVGMEETAMVIRRARGLVPEPVVLKRALDKPSLALGGDLKNTFALGRGKGAYLSQHFGDMAERSVERVRDRELVRLKRLLSITDTPETVGDLHPLYYSAQGAGHRIQHHQAHILSVMAEHTLTGPVLGLAFDGTGYGTDQTIWGSEFLILNGASFEKKGSLLPVKLLAGDAGMKEAGHTLTAYLYAAGESLKGEEKVIAAALYNGDAGVYNSSMGRLFDAAAAALSLCCYNSYEGECPVKLEEAAERAALSHPLGLELLEKDGFLYGNGPKLIHELKKLRLEGVPVESLALGFHEAVALFCLSAGEKIAKEAGVKTICLSGGTFLNRILFERLVTGFRDRGFAVYHNIAVPCTDGGLSLGQLYYLTFTGEQTCV